MGATSIGKPPKKLRAIIKNLIPPLMTDRDAFELISKGGATDFAKTVSVCAAAGHYCMIGGLAVNCYVEPVYTMDADIVISSNSLDAVQHQLQSSGFTIEEFPHSLNAQMPGSSLRIQFTKDSRYQSFVARATEKEVLGVKVKVAALEDLVQGKIWAWEDSTRRLSKRQKDQADLIRIAEAFPEMQKHLPQSLQDLFRAGKAK